MWQVTAGANGLGRAISSELASYGCNVAIADIDIENAREFAEELTFLGVKAKAYKVLFQAENLSSEFFNYHCEFPRWMLRTMMRLWH